MIIFILFSICFGISSTAPTEDLVSTLPGLPISAKMPKMYSGYLHGGKSFQLHYVFVLSSQNHSKVPLMLWLNGGPGCSSMLGFFQEIGPYRISKNGEHLLENPYSWDKIGHVLYLESPACVGYSYKENQSNCTSSDTSSKLQNYNALLSFLKKFPEYKFNPLYIMGESYGGIYVPLLTQYIHDHKNSNKLNLKGYSIINGMLSYEMSFNTKLYYGYYHGFLSSKTWIKLRRYCCNHVNCLFTRNLIFPRCQEAIEEAMSYESNPNLNMYDVTGICYNSNGKFVNSTNSPNYMRQLMSAWAKEKYVGRKVYYTRTESGLPCEFVDNLLKYMNSKDLRRAFNIPSHLREWETCSDFPYGRENFNMKNVILDLVSGNVKGLLIYGDQDTVCDFLMGEWFVDNLKLPEELPWSSWLAGGQIGGFGKSVKNLRYTTIRGASHEVPQKKPLAAFTIVKDFVLNSM